jgi:hypothetical protein
VIQVVCCRLTDLQRDIYQHFASSATARRIISEAEYGDRHAGGNKILAVRPRTGLRVSGGFRGLISP